MLLIEWRMHFRTFIFQMCSMKTKPKANMSHTSSRKWGEIISLRLTLWCCQNTPTWSAMTLSHLCLSLNPPPPPRTHNDRVFKCFNDGHGASAHNLYNSAWTKCTQMQHHSTKVTSHIPWQLDHDSNGPLETIPGANVIIVQKNELKRRGTSQQR